MFRYGDQPTMVDEATCGPRRHSRPARLCDRRGALVDGEKARLAGCQTLCKADMHDSQMPNTQGPPAPWNAETAAHIDALGLADRVKLDALHKALERVPGLHVLCIWFHVFECVHVCVRAGFRLLC